MLKLSVTVLMVIIFAATSHAGWFDDAVTGAAERLGNRAVDDAAEGAYDGGKEGIRKSLKKDEEGTSEVEESEKPAPKKKAKQKKTQEGNDAEDPAPAQVKSNKTVDKTNTPGSGQDLVAAEEIFSKYDFVPGDKVIFFDDFSDTDTGEFPRKWTLNGPKGDWNNAVEVVDFKGKRYLRSKPAQEEFGQNGATQCTLEYQG